jgi:DNA-binding IclR family transcriptional regulator
VTTLFDVVEGLQTLGTAGVSELADHLGRPKSTVHIYLATLVEEGYVIKEGDQYRSSLRFLELGGQTRKRMSIYEAARPEIDSLSRETGEVANFAIEEQGKRVLLYSSEPHEGVFDNSPTGQYTNMHWTALGKALLSQLSDDRVAEIVADHGLPEATPNTITDRDELFEELAVIRDRGFSIEDEERREGIKSVAVPVQHTDDSSPVSAVSISGPRRRIGEEQIKEQFLDAIMDTVNVIELKNKHY